MSRKRSRFAAYRHIVSLFMHDMPYDGACSLFYYIFENFSPAIHTIILAGLFNAAYRILNGGAAELHNLILFGVVFVLFNLLKQILQILSSISINAGIYEKTFQLLKTRIAEKSSKLALIAYEDNVLLDIKKRAEECVNNDRLPGIYMLGIVLSTSVFGIVSLFITLWYYYWALAVIVILSTGQFFAAAYLTGKQRYAQNERLTAQRRKRDYIWSLFFDKRYLKEMRLLGFDGYLKAKWSGIHDCINRELWDLELKESRRFMLCDGIKLGGYVFGIVFSLILLLNDTISIGVFGACITALFTMQNLIKDFFSSIGRLPHFLDLANDYFDYINLPEENIGGVSYQGIKTEITVRNADFIYPGSKEKTLKNINLTIRAGEKVVILGVNGSGKTTLTKLLTGIYPAAGGQICYDGVPVGEINRVQFFQKLSIISQDFIVYNISLKENIALADIEKLGDTERIERSLVNVGLKELPADPDNLNKIIGREFSGLELSTGQRQRIAIARAVFKDSDCIILDEPTSALDPLLEAEILKGFIRLSENKTALIISHRTGLCTMVDNIAVMKEGELVEYGTHDTLLRQKGEYARLYEMQKKWYV